MVNGLGQEGEFGNEGLGHDNLGVRFNNWEIGADKDGLTGTIDKLEVSNQNPDAKPAKKSEPLWVKAAIGSAIGVFTILLICAMSKCCASCCKGSAVPAELDLN